MVFYSSTVTTIYGPINIKNIYFEVFETLKLRNKITAAHAARMGERKITYFIFVGKSEGPEGKRPLGRLIRRWEDNIKMNLREVRGAETGWSWLRLGTNGGDS